MKHVPVLLNATVDALAVKPGGVYIDGTLGRAGHAREILARAGAGSTLVGIDRDEQALKESAEVLKEFPEARIETVHGRHGDIGERPVGEIAIHALRGGSVVGDHTVMFAGELERVELTHKAQDRAAFAAGALKAVAWAKGRAPGIYTMQDVLKVE